MFIGFPFPQLKQEYYLVDEESYRMGVAAGTAKGTIMAQGISRGIMAALERASLEMAAEAADMPWWNFWSRRDHQKKLDGAAEMLTRAVEGIMAQATQLSLPQEEEDETGEG